MKRNVVHAVCLFVLVTALSASAQVRPAKYFPDIDGYNTLMCDFHMHTVFSDGNVWPTTRVQEAVREGIDAISITDHIEYQPHKEDIPTNHNRPYDVAKGHAKKKNILLIKGTEITRDTPPGHYNAIFLEDINPLDTPDFFECHRAAEKQNAFTFWNHHTWKGEDKGKWSETQDQMLAEKLIDGMEVANGNWYYPLAHQYCLEKDLTFIGNSDIHDPSIKPDYEADDHRTLTLVFAKDRSIEGIREALDARRTAVWFKNQLIGRPDVLEPLFFEILTMSEPVRINDKTVCLEVTNNALIDLKIVRTGDEGPKKLTIPANSRYYFTIKHKPEQTAIPYSFKVENFLVAPNTPLEATAAIHLTPKTAATASASVTQ